MRFELDNIVIHRYLRMIAFDFGQSKINAFLIVINQKKQDRIFKYMVFCGLVNMIWNGMNSLIVCERL